MSMLSRIKLVLLMTLVFVPSVAFSAPPDIPSGAMCDECGMKVDAKSPFAAQATVGGKTLSFCDIGDMLSHYKNAKTKPENAYVKDYRSNSWIEAASAYYVKSFAFRTPMGWGIAAFKDEKDAAQAGKPMTFQEALSALGGGETMEHGEHMKH